MSVISMKLSKRTTDAIQILAACHREGGRLVKVAHVADALGLTKQVALKTANLLVQTGLLATVRGPNGGIRLSPLAQEASLADIVRGLERAPIESLRQSDSIALDSYFDDAFEAFLQVLDQHTLADLAKGGGPSVAGRVRETPRRRSRQGKRRGRSDAAGDSDCC